MDVPIRVDTAKSLPNTPIQTPIESPSPSPEIKDILELCQKKSLLKKEKPNLKCSHVCEKIEYTAEMFENLKIDALERAEYVFKTKHNKNEIQSMFIYSDIPFLWSFVSSPDENLKMIVENMNEQDIIFTVEIKFLSK
jgi:hypothetical protein